MNKLTNRILIVTTEGCEACNIAEDNITSAVAQSSIDLDIQVKDYHEFTKQEQKDYKLKDYPTVLYMFGETILFRSVGTYPIPVYLRWIDIYFKK
jgi:hypothetical protein